MLIDSNRIQGACTVAGRTGIVDQFRLAAGKMRMSALTTTAPVGTWVWGDRIDYINPVTTGYSGIIYVSTGVWKDYGLIT